MTKSLAVVTALFASALSAAPAFAQATVPAECQPMMAAGEKQFTVPSHAVMTTTGMGPAPMTSEVVNIEGTTYVKVMDHWMKSPMSSADLAKQAKAKMAAGKTSCTQKADESVDGVVGERLRLAHRHRARRHRHAGVGREVDAACR